MVDRNEFYTVGIWIAKNGSEQNLIETWRRHSSEALLGRGATEFKLMQDPVDSRRFLSCATWGDGETLQAWRKSPEFREFVSKMVELCSDYDVIVLKSLATLTAAASVPPPGLPKAY
jgi:heme-degrading monooxygenase HmoA